jgi:HSP20 family protein
MTLERWRPRWAIGRWQPFRELEEMERHFADVFGRPFWQRLPIEEKGWVPPIEVFEKEDKFVVKAELPGMKEEDIDISISGDTLTIKGERKAETEVKEEDYYCCERSYGSFLRSLALPSTVDASKIEAGYEDGVLEISLPKATEVKPKKVAVSTKKAASAKKPASAPKKKASK